MAPWRCVRCGEEIEIDGDVCPRCGAGREGDAVGESENLAVAQVAEVACKMLAVGMATYAVYEYLEVVFAPFFATLSPYANWPSKSLMLLGALKFVYLVVPFLLWRYARAIGRQIAGYRTEPIVSIGVDSEQLLVVACSAIGIYGIWAGTVSICHTVGTLILFAQQFDKAISLSNLRAEWQAKFIADLAGVAFSAVLAFRARSVVGFLDIFGQRSATDEDEPAAPTAGGETEGATAP